MEQIFQTHGAVRMKLFAPARVIQQRNARAAVVTMHVFFAPFHATNAALVTMIIISLNAIIKEVAHGTKICGELDAATKACVRYGLLHITLIAHHLFDRVPVHLVRLGVVVAVAAPIYIVAARGHQTAPSHIVLATMFAIVHILLFNINNT
jgi:hypothetical protein